MDQGTLTSAAAGAPPSSSEDELTALKKELAKVKAKLEEWSRRVENAAIGSPEETKAKEREAIFLQRVTALEQQIAERRKYIEENTAKRVQYMTSSTIVPFDERITYSTATKYLGLPMNLVSTAGLAQPPTDKRLLFCRDAVHEQMSFLRKTVLDEGHTGFVYGPPGTGKSNTALAFCLSNETQECVVTWIHLRRVGNELNCFQLKRNNTLVRIENVSNESLADLLFSVTEKHLVILDGYADAITMHVDLRNTCIDWFEKGQESRRLVIVSSMSSLIKLSADDKANLHWKEHIVCSWEFAEYAKAVEDNSFFDSVKQYLDAGDDSLPKADTPQLSGEQKLSLVKAKYYFAGGSSRFMFSNSTNEVMEELKKGLDLVPDIRKYFFGDVGDRSSQAINRLLGRLPHPDEKHSFRVFIISMYASLLFTKKMGPDTVLTYADYLASLRNPSLMGWIFKMLFFSVLRHRDVRLLDAHDEPVVWTKAEPRLVDPLKFAFTEEATRDNVWYQPEKWNQGAYDAVFIAPADEKEKYLVRFVQVASGDTHDLRLDIIYAFMNHCKEYFETKALEIIFLIPKPKRKVFKIGNVTGSGLLIQFGWTRGKESEQCKIWALDEKWEYKF